MITIKIIRIIITACSVSHNAHDTHNAHDINLLKFKHNLDIWYMCNLT